MPRLNVLVAAGAAAAVGVPKGKPPPDAVLLAGVPKLKEPLGFDAGCAAAAPKLNPPPEAAGVELVMSKDVPVIAAVVF